MVLFLSLRGFSDLREKFIYLTLHNSNKDLLIKFLFTVAKSQHFDRRSAHFYDQGKIRPTIYP